MDCLCISRVTLTSAERSSTNARVPADLDYIENGMQSSKYTKYITERSLLCLVCKQVVLFSVFMERTLKYAFGVNRTVFKEGHLPRRFLIT